MKLLLTLLLVLFIGCTPVSEHQDWDFMQSVGGVIVAGQDKNPNWLILRGDISGLKEFTSKPTTLNSALAIKSIERNITESEIYIYVNTTAINKKYNSSKISGIDISGVKKGMYKVLYLNPDNSSVHLKDIEIY